MIGMLPPTPTTVSLGRILVIDTDEYIHAGRTGLVFDDEVTAGLFLHDFTHNPRQRVDQAARGKGSPKCRRAHRCPVGSHSRAGWYRTSAAGIAAGASL